MTHAAVGWNVALKCMMWRRPCSMTKNPFRSLFNAKAKTAKGRLTRTGRRTPASDRPSCRELVRSVAGNDVEGFPVLREKLHLGRHRRLTVVGSIDAHGFPGNGRSTGFVPVSKLPALRPKTVSRPRCHFPLPSTPFKTRSKRPRPLFPSWTLFLHSSEPRPTRTKTIRAVAARCRL